MPLSAQAKAHNTPIGIQRAAGVAPATHSPALGDFGLRPADIHAAYELPESATTEQTIALIDAYNDPTAEADLATYSTTFGLPECTTANGCFKKVGETGLEGTLPFPKTTAELETAEAGGAGAKEEAEAAIGWGAEISLDIESAHATCPNCHILLVEANTTSYTDLEKAEKTAETLGATELSNSWGGPEEGVTVGHDSTGPFNDPKVVITASSGDNGFLGWDSEFEGESGFTNYPAASPHVVAVGGTRLTLGAESKWSNETVWNGSGASGGGCSIQFTAPAWQQSVANWSSIGCTNKRVVADVAADADPHSGVAVTDSSSACETEYAEGGSKHVVHWCTYGGTSLASPIVAGVFALAGGAGSVAYPAQTLYENRLAAPASLHDVTNGSNGECTLGFNPKTGLSSCTPAESAAASCESTGSCLAGTGFDGPTGVGTPHGILGFVPTGKGAGEEEPPSEEEAEEEPEEKEQPPVKEGAPGKPVGTPPATTPTPPPAVAASTTPVISSLGLTIRAVIALDAHRPVTSKIAFSFMLSSPANVKRQARKTHPHPPPDALEDRRQRRDCGWDQRPQQREAERAQGAPAGPLPPDGDAPHRPVALDPHPHQLSAPGPAEGGPGAIVRSAALAGVLDLDPFAGADLRHEAQRRLEVATGAFEVFGGGGRVVRIDLAQELEGPFAGDPAHGDVLDGHRELAEGLGGRPLGNFNREFLVPALGQRPRRLSAAAEPDSAEENERADRRRPQCPPLPARLHALCPPFVGRSDRRRTAPEDNDWRAAPGSPSTS